MLGRETETPALGKGEEEQVSIKKDLYVRLVKTQVIKQEKLEDIQASPDPEIKLSQAGSIHYLNGVLLGQYLLTIKRVMVSQY